MKEPPLIGITRSRQAEPAADDDPPGAAQGSGDRGSDGSGHTARDDDARLAARILAGDDAAFDRFYEANVGRVHAVMLRMCGDESKALRLTQEAFIRAWERIGTFGGRSRLSSWLHRIAVNVAIEAGRRRSRWWGRLAPEAAGRDALDRAASQPAVRLDLERAIAALPDRAREALVLRDVEGHSYEEIASLMGVAVGTVKAQVHRARGLVREMLER